LIRYFALSAAIVLAVLLVATAWVARDLIRIRIASVSIPSSPKPAAAVGGSGIRTPRPFEGDAPWALSALPGCFDQIERVSGTDAYVRARLPADAVAIAPPATVVYADCTISIAGGEAYVRRGPDRFRIPPMAQFYRSNDRLVVYRHEAGSSELRIYQRSTISSQ
jgi:hypothetical protein